MTAPDPHRRADLGQGAWLIYDAGWIPKDEADALFGDLLASQTWEQRSIRVFDREIPQPRLMAWGGEPVYAYSGLVLEPRPEAPVLAALREAASRVAGVAFNHTMLNLYRDGRDHVGWHADAERELGREPVIGSVSLGTVRRFALSPKRKRRVERVFRLAHGSLLVMGGSCQHTWRHALLKDPTIEGPRINVTFRRIVG